jgi:hypothetical protein
MKDGMTADIGADIGECGRSRVTAHIADSVRASRNVPRVLRRRRWLICAPDLASVVCSVRAHRAMAWIGSQACVLTCGFGSAERPDSGRLWPMS